MGGSAPLLPLLWLSMDLLDQRLQLLARVESDHPACGDGNFLAGLRVAARALRLVAKLEVAEAGELHRVPGLQRDADLLEKRLDHVLRFTLVEPDLLEQHIRELSFGECHYSLPRHAISRRISPRATGSAAPYPPPLPPHP